MKIGVVSPNHITPSTDGSLVQLGDEEKTLL